MRVITYQSPGGERINLCAKHQRLTTRDAQGREHCTVSRGLHAGRCAVCDGAYPPDEEPTTKLDRNDDTQYGSAGNA